VNWTDEEYEQYVIKSTKTVAREKKGINTINNVTKKEKSVTSQNKSKYHNKKTEVDGIKFDSKKESQYYLKLKTMKESGEIKDFERQVKYVLVDKFTLNGKSYREIYYKADFVIEHLNGTKEVVDVKASKFFQDSVYKLKKKMLANRYGIEIREVY
jgi:hypothetical protein